MHLLIAIALVLGMFSVFSLPAAAQSIVIISTCEKKGSKGPSVTYLQQSLSGEALCSDLTPETREFCQGFGDLVSKVEAGLSCAAAREATHRLGIEEIFVAAVAGDSSATPPAQNRYVFQNNQTDLQFLTRHASGAVDLLGCALSPAEGPRATFVQRSDDPEDAALDMACVDALQESIDSGSVLSPTDSLAIAGTALPGVRAQQGRLILDSDSNEASSSEFVIVRVGHWSRGPN